MYNNLEVVVFFLLAFCFSNVKELNGHNTNDEEYDSPKPLFTTSANNAQQHQASLNCKGKGKQLAALRTSEQMDGLKEFLKHYNDGQEGFWVDARYDKVQKQFVWQDLADPVKFEIKKRRIDFYEEPKILNELTGLQVKYRGSKLWYKSANMNLNQRYICQANSTNLKICKWVC